MLALERERAAIGAQLWPTPLWVAIGASAGGLEALQGFLRQLRPNGRTCYVVAQHMASDGHQRLMGELLGRICPLPVRLMTQGETPVADTVTVVPAGANALWEAGRLILRAPSTRYFSTPSVDALLVSLAEGVGASAAAVILSGAGSDGALGAAAVRRCGGRVCVQSPGQARFDGMPMAALRAVPDAAVLNVEDMAAQWRGQDASAEDLSARSQRDLAALVAHVRQVTGVDFSGYKIETLARRAARRQGELGLGSLAAYRCLVEQQPQEAWTLQRRFLVSVSSFFRDPLAFEALGKAWRGARANGTNTWRCWAPACASGEEAYSLAMLHAQAQHEGACTRELDVLATDLNDEALAHAREAIYRPKATREVHDDLRRRYFTPRGGDLEVVARIRANVRFEKQDILAVQPAGPWDVISCRNLLIYLQPALQERLIADFHARMAPGGWLFISPSETLSQSSLRLFSPFDMNHRIYRRLP